MLTQLQTLQLYDNNLQRLPDGVCQLTQLRHLSCGVNRLVAVPEQVGRLVNLRELCRSGVGLSSTRVEEKLEVGQALTSPRRASRRVLRQVPGL